MPHRSAPARRSFIVGAASLLIMSTAHARVGIPKGAAPSTAQLRFGEAIEHYAVLASTVSLIEARDKLMAERGRALRAVLGEDMSFSQWVGSKFLTSGANGEMFAWLTIAANGKGRSASITNLDLRSPKSSSPIESSSIMASTLSEVPDRGAVLASGVFFADERRGLADGMPIPPKSDANQFNEPSFLVRFDAIERPAWFEDLDGKTRHR